MHNQFEDLFKALPKAIEVPKLQDELTPDELSRYTSIRLDNMVLIQNLINQQLKIIDDGGDGYADNSTLTTLNVLGELSKEYK